jgi:hypothetical protein
MHKPTQQELTKYSVPVVRKHCGPIFFTRSLEKASKETIIANGSFGLVNTGEKKILVTCDHVWEGFEEAHFHDKEMKMCVCLDLGNPVYFDHSRLIDHDKQADLPTFDMTGLSSACKGLKFSNIKSKPPPTVKKGDIVVLIGFPGHGRITGDSFITFTRNPFGLIISSVDGNRFHSDLTNLTWKLDQDKYKGISGCPAFKVTYGRLSQIQLVGFAREVWMNQLMFAHAGQILPDGKIKRC